MSTDIFSNKPLTTKSINDEFIFSKSDNLNITDKQNPLYKSRLRN